LFTVERQLQVAAVRCGTAVRAGSSLGRGGGGALNASSTLSAETQRGGAR